jgi:hypothetical protein
LCAGGALHGCGSSLTRVSLLSCAQIWDYTLRGIDNQSAELSSKALFAGSFLTAGAAAVM